MDGRDLLKVISNSSPVYLFQVLQRQEVQILGTSRIDPLKKPGDIGKISSTIKMYGIDGLVVIGGNGTLSAAYELTPLGIPLIGDTQNNR